MVLDGAAPADSPAPAIALSDSPYTVVLSSAFLSVVFNPNAYPNPKYGPSLLVVY